MSIRPEQYSDMLAELRESFASGLTKDLAWRDSQLAAIEKLLQENEPAIERALADDLGKPPQEVLLGELALLYSSIRYIRKHLRRWAKPRRVSTPAVGQPGRSWVQPEPLGVVLVMGAWNYPLQLVFGPLLPVLAAGNCAVLKPSEIAPKSSALMAELIPLYLDERAVKVVEGAVDETTELLKQRFDHIIYTGGAAVGKIVMLAAAEHLTPVTLELGGKSPCVIDKDADLSMAARRLMWGKCINAGQSCIAPDYVLVSSEQRDDLVAAIDAELNRMYGEDRLGSDDYANIVNERHFKRVSELLNDGQIVIGGAVDQARNRIEPTVMVDVDPDSALMREEIFGPVLPILTVSDLDEAMAFILKRDKPLAAYLFSGNKQSEQRFVEQISSGNMCINDVIMFMAVHELPFGGVGMSGMGQYHGRTGFDRLSHLKAVMRRTRTPEPPVRFAPYSEMKMKLLRWLS
ncbi:MAG TPA: aldehyde dehydrogenase family protein [Wenzhouxiangella sp.]|nr:aldehyde dehydrogenase family protein [Wenzhouxiangella sp.]